MRGYQRELLFAHYSTLIRAEGYIEMQLRCWKRNKDRNAVRINFPKFAANLNEAAESLCCLADLWRLTLPATS